MDSSGRLIVAMAKQCRGTVQGATGSTPNLPSALRPSHLLWMCDRIERHAEDWPATKLHRWIGFIQCAMLANGMLDLVGAKAMFDEAKLSHGEPGQDQDLLDHLNPQSSFALDIGGQG